MTARGKQERRSLTLWPEEWEELERLAEGFNTCPPSGRGAGEPSWRSLIKEIARGAIGLERIREPEPVVREYDTMPCPFCDRVIPIVGGGVNHLRAHVRRGEAEEVMVTLESGEEKRRFRRPGETYSPEEEACTAVVMPAGSKNDS